MKSREEYEKSIYAKRDALIIKGKQKIAAVSSALCIVICFVAAAIFLPKTINKAAFDTTTSTTVPTTVEDLLVGMSGETGLFDAVGEAEKAESAQTSEQDKDTYFTMASEYSKPATTSKKSSTRKHQVNFGYTPEDYAETAFPVANQTEIALETEIHWEDGSILNKPSTTVKPLHDDGAEQKAIDAAYGYLTDEQKANVDMDAHIDVSVTRNADGTEYFTVHFDTADGAYLVSVDSKNFEFVKFRELKKTTQMVFQGYNPDTTTAKPPMMPSTTTAPEYIPD